VSVFTVSQTSRDGSAWPARAHVLDLSFLAADDLLGQTA
jgi:hypothetical protein